MERKRSETVLTEPMQPVKTEASLDAASVDLVIPDSQQQKGNVTSIETVKSLLAEPIVGYGRYNYFMWKVYDATLFSRSGFFSWKQPFVLKLDYHRSLNGVDIAKRSIKEIRRQDVATEIDNSEIKLAAWYAQMSDIFPDVEAGDAIVGVYLPDHGAQFWQGETKLGEVNDTEFSRSFFDIWLGPQTSAPDLRAALLGKDEE